MAPMNIIAYVIIQYNRDSLETLKEEIFYIHCHTSFFLSTNY